MGSVRRRGAVIRVDLESTEVVLLASLVGQVQQLLTEDHVDAAADPAADPAADAVLTRLLPDAYRDDPESAAEFRRLMDGDLRQQKAEALQRVLDDISGTGAPHRDGQRFELADDAVTPWLYALTDVRLALGTTLEVSEDMTDELAALDRGSPRFAGLAVYDWVGWLQQSIVEAASG